MANKIKVLMLNYEFPPLGGGAANANHYLLKEYSKNPNLSVDLVTSSKGSFEFEKFSKNINIYKLNVRKKELHYWKMSELLIWSIKAYQLSKKLIRNENYDICHCWFGWPPGVIGYLFRKKIPYIVALRGSDVPGYSNRLKILDLLLFKRLSKKVWSNAEKVIANSKGLKSLALQTATDQKVGVIYNGVDTEEFRPKHKTSTEKPIKLISTGRLIERKGYKYLIEAIKNDDNFELKLIGGGNRKKELEELAKQMNANVKFLGEVEHGKIPELLSQSDIFVLPSLNEGMSNSILEAMASGLPIITTNTGGSKELIDKNGYIIKKKSSRSIKSALEKYLKSKRLIRLQGRRSRKIAENIDWDKVAKSYQKCYEDINNKYRDIYKKRVSKIIKSDQIVTWRTRQESLLKYIYKEIDKNKKILELGSGRGFLVKELKEKGYRVTGSDFNPLNINLAKKLNRQTLKELDAEKINIQNNFFDVVISVELIEHLPNLDRHLSEVGRILKKNGFYLISTPNKFIENIFNIARGRNDPFHLSSQSLYSLRNILKKHGFSCRFLKMNDLTLGQKKKMGYFKKLYPVRYLPISLQPSIICVAKLINKNEH